MRAMFGLVLVAGVGLAGAAVYMTKGYINQTQSALSQERSFREKTGPMVQVFVVNKEKNYGDALTKDDVTMIYWQENSLPEGVFKDEAELFPDEGKNPRYILRQMEKFEPLLAVKVTEPGQPAGLTGQLAKGERAFAIKVDVSTGVSGFVQPGDRVDVYWTGTPDGGSSELTRLIEGTLKIIAVDQKADGQSGAATVARTVTVAASPESVARLAQAAATGKLSLSLVGNGDDEIIQAKVEVDSNGLLGITPEVAAPEIAPAPPPPEEKVCTIRTRKGADAIDVPIPCTN
jgi:pilus assembly protein CpaB